MNFRVGPRKGTLYGWESNVWKFDTLFISAEVRNRSSFFQLEPTE